MSRQTVTVTQNRTECSFMFPIAVEMFLSVVGSDSKCALWQNYTQAFSTLFSEGVTGQIRAWPIRVSRSSCACSIDCHVDDQTNVFFLVVVV